MKKFVAFGELMLRLCPPLHHRITTVQNFEANYAGCEANTAVSLANYGIETYYMSKFPDNLLGDAALRSLRQMDINTQYIVRGGERLGIFFIEHGAGLRSSKVVYDRKHSAFAQADEKDFDFDAALSGKDWFHTSGISTAVSPKAARLTKMALQSAKKQGLTVSFDINHRQKLWSQEEARAICEPLMEYVDLYIGSVYDAQTCLGFQLPDVDLAHEKLDDAAYTEIFSAMKKQYGFSFITSTLREHSSASENSWSAILYDGERLYRSTQYKLHIVDRIGGGDAFDGGLIYALLAGRDSQQALDFATAASALKHTIHGDFNQVSIAEVEAVLAGQSGGRVER